MSTEYDDEEELGDYEGRTDKEHRVGGSLQVRGGMPEGVVCDPESALWSWSFCGIIVSIVMFIGGVEEM